MIAVTTVHKAPIHIVETARKRAKVLGLPYLLRENTLESMETNDIHGFLVYGKKGPSLWVGGSTHAFHTGTAKLRLLGMKRGDPDRLCTLLPVNVKTILDCTFGEGKDSLVLSWFLGDAGRVIAVEKSAALWEIGQYGLSHFEDEDLAVTGALRRISLIHGDFRQILHEAGENAWDVVYMDAMFRRPVKAETNNRDAFRYGACHDQVDIPVLQAAVRAARCRVIVKERPFAEIFRSGLFTHIQCRHGQTTAYGVIDTERERL